MPEVLQFHPRSERNQVKERLPVLKAQRLDSLVAVLSLDSWCKDLSYSI